MATVNFIKALIIHRQQTFDLEFFSKNELGVSGLRIFVPWYQVSHIIFDCEEKVFYETKV